MAHPLLMSAFRILAHMLSKSDGMSILNGDVKLEKIWRKTHHNQVENVIMGIRMFHRAKIH
jgi:hypothetical protein